jgi:hypothetical protein
MPLNYDEILEVRALIDEAITKLKEESKVVVAAKTVEAKDEAETEVVEKAARPSRTR